MSRTARRALHITAAAAGIASLGAGFAGSAVAAPAAPLPDAASAPGEVASSLPLSSLPLSSLPVAPLPGTPAAPELPMLFTFQAPTVNTAGPADGALPERIPGGDQLPAADAVPALGSALSVADTVPTRPSQVGALSALDSAGLFGAQDNLVSVEGVDTPTDQLD